MICTFNRGGLARSEGRESSLIGAATTFVRSSNGGTRTSLEYQCYGHISVPRDNGLCWQLRRLNGTGVLNSTCAPSLPDLYMLYAAVAISDFTNTTDCTLIFTFPTQTSNLSSPRYCAPLIIQTHAARLSRHSQFNLTLHCRCRYDHGYYQFLYDEKASRASHQARGCGALVYPSFL